MKKYTNKLIILGLLVSACSSQLDVEPEDSISASQLSEDDINSLLNGTYSLYRDIYGDGNPSNIDLIFDFDLLTEGIETTGSGVYRRFGNNLLDATLTNEIWVKVYLAISGANQTLAILENNESISERDNLLAQALYLRALGHFELVKRFGGVPLIDRNTVAIVPRSTEEEIYEFVINDLERALSLSNNFDGTTSIVSTQAIEAMLARVYQATGDNAQALEMAESLIDSNLFSLDAFDNIFNSNVSTELIFGFGNDDEVVDLFAIFRPVDFPGGGSYFLFPESNTFSSLYEEDDQRDPVTFLLFNNRRVFAKYVNNTTVPLIISRIAEMYLISAEAQGYPNGVNRLNELRLARGVEVINPTSESAFIEALLLERRREFYGEGHYWFDLKRLNLLIDKVPSITTERQLLYPIPQEQIDVTGYQQNPGY